MHDKGESKLLTFLTAECTVNWRLSSDNKIVYRTIARSGDGSYWS